MIELAVDPSNSFNQQYLLEVLLEICSQFAPPKSTSAEIKQNKSKIQYDPRSLKSQRQIAILE